jgi:hypothetical protein
MGRKTKPFRFLSFAEFLRLTDPAKLTYVEDALVHLRDPQNTGRPMFTDVPTPPTAGRAGERESVRAENGEESFIAKDANSRRK